MRKLGLATFAVGGLLLSLVGTASSQIIWTTTQKTFTSTFLGKVTTASNFYVQNSGKSAITVNSWQMSNPEFQVSYGVVPTTLKSKNKATYSVQFAPTATGSQNGTLTVYASDGSSAVLSLSGIGKTVTGSASVSSASLSFDEVPLGTTSAGMVVTITNTGSSTVTLSAVTPVPLQFTATGAALPLKMAKGTTTTLSVYYSPSDVVALNGTLDLTFDSLPDIGVSLAGTGAAATQLALSTLPALPKATVNASYQYPLQTTAAIAPVSWSVDSLSALPTGMSLSADGVLSGVPSSLGTYAFTLDATDSSSPPLAASRTFSLAVQAATGASCNQISFSGGADNSLLTPLENLGEATYFGFAGGLYPGVSNIMPADHQADGIAFAQAIQPWDATGVPSATGKYVILAVGISGTKREFDQFIQLATADPKKNPGLVVVDGAAASETAHELSSATSPYWNLITQALLPNAGVTAQQVGILYVEDVDSIAAGTFPSDMQGLQADLEGLLQNALVLFPNLKMAYLGGRPYGGYSNGVSVVEPEPFVYESGFANQWVVADQINGVAAMNYQPLSGPVLAPWVAWGSYNWANGMVPRLDGTYYTCQDFRNDGLHPSTDGDNKVSGAMLQFFKTDPTATPWFLAH